MDMISNIIEVGKLSNQKSKEDPEPSWIQAYDVEQLSNELRESNCILRKLIGPPQDCIIVAQNGFDSIANGLIAKFEQTKLKEMDNKSVLASDNLLDLNVKLSQQQHISTFG